MNEVRRQLKPRQVGPDLAGRLGLSSPPRAVRASGRRFERQTLSVSYV